METNFIIHGLIAVIIIGVFYNLWISTRAYGGIIGRAIRLLGVGLLLITMAVIEKIIINFGIIENTAAQSMLQDVLNLIGLFFLAWGFSKLASVAKS